MAIPGFQSITLPLLKLSADQKEHIVPETEDRLTSEFRLSKEEREEMLPSGTTQKFVNGVSRVEITKQSFISMNTIFCCVVMGLFFFSCECVQRAQGVVLDRDTKLPISEVIISTKDIMANTIVGHVDHTNELGQFNYEGGLAGATPNCPDVTLYFFKWGYKKVKQTFSPASVNDTILLEKTIVVTDVGP